MRQRQPARAARNAQEFADAILGRRPVDPRETQAFVESILGGNRHQSTPRRRDARRRGVMESQSVHLMETVWLGDDAWALNGQPMKGAHRR